MNGKLVQASGQLKEDVALPLRLIVQLFAHISLRISHLWHSASPSPSLNRTDKQRDDRLYPLAVDKQKKIDVFDCLPAGQYSLNTPFQLNSKVLLLECPYWNPECICL